MSYVRIVLNLQTPPNVSNFVHDYLDMQFHDAHCMLRLPVKEQELEASCNFATATVVLALISGLSALLEANLSTHNKSGRCFKSAMFKFYPWHKELILAERKRVIKHLYEVFSKSNGTFFWSQDRRQFQSGCC